MLQACLVVLWLARAGWDHHQTLSWSYRCLVKHFVKLESFLPGVLVEEDIKERIFLTWLSSLPSVVVVGASGESPLEEKTTFHPHGLRLLKNARSSLSYVESVQDVGVTPRKILGRGLQFSFVKKKNIFICQ